MPSFHSRTADTNDDWQTPLYIIEALGNFDFDPCPNPNDLKRCAQFGCEGDGLSEQWIGRVWLNPPYGDQCKFWMQKLADHGNGIAIIPPRLGSIWFHEIVLSTCDKILALKGRVAFINAKTGEPVKGNNADSILVAYGKQNAETLSKIPLEGALLSVENFTKVNADALLKELGI